MKIKNNKYIDGLLPSEEQGKDEIDLDKILGWDDEATDEEARTKAENEQSTETETETGTDTETETELTGSEEINVEKTFKELLIGILIFFVIMHLSHFLVGMHLLFEAGLIVGTVMAGLMSFSMLEGVKKAVCYDSNTATKITKRAAFFRFLIMIAVFGVTAYFFGLSMFFGVFLGMLSLKLSAYIQPLTHRCITKLQK